MSRKNLLTSLTEKKLTVVNSAPATEVSPSPSMERNRNRGAFGAITRSIDELAEKAQAAKDMEARLLEGAAVVELDPTVIDGSFVADRLGDDEEAFNELLTAIQARGQDSPILVRPHPGVGGRYMAVFGHRRLRAAKALGRKVRAVVKEIDDQDHVIAQGQENSARADLSFIEKALFASNLERGGHDREVIMQALSVDKTVVSKMLAVTNDIPVDIIHAIGPAKGTGRDRWVLLKSQLESSRSKDVARSYVASADFAVSRSDDRFNLLLNFLSAKKAVRSRDVKPWAPADNLVSVSVKKAGKTAIVTLGAKDGLGFADYITGRLEVLYEDFRKSQAASAGD